MPIEAQHFTPPPASCQHCPRLAEFRNQNTIKFPHFFNGAVPSFGSLDAEFLVIGLAPGLKGANQTGRPFTGDFAGDVLYGALAASGFASGTYAKHAEDGFALNNVRITNAVRCVPPQNKPLPEEVVRCGEFLKHEIAAMPNLKHILCLGKLSHDATLKVLGQKLSKLPFAHGAKHIVIVGQKTLTLWDSYHTSRYNIQTRRLTFDAFLSLVKIIQSEIEN